jgi:hypothetical protein
MPAQHMLKTFPTLGPRRRHLCRFSILAINLFLFNNRAGISHPYFSAEKADESG